jgi:hypothetical protein
MGFTGNRMESELGLLNINIGGLKVNNSVFLVFADSLLSFANGAYVINGVIGFPIMDAFQEMIFEEDKFVTIPEQPDTLALRNFALDDANPVILVSYKNDSLPFHFDTGADRTIFFDTFLKRYQTDIIGHSTKKNSTIGGAGGTSDVESYILDTALIAAGNEQARLYSIQVLTKELSYDHRFVYGNFGQDYIKKFNIMKMNLSAMSITFSDRKADQ